MKYFVVDAFADSVFTGNPAGACLTDARTMQALAHHHPACHGISEHH